MSWSAEEQRGIKRALLGSWPGTITQWGKDAFAAYIGELEARGLDAGSVLLAVRTWPAGSDFPPSAPNLAAQARKDPSVPTFEEALELIRVCLKARTTVRKTFWELGEREKCDDIAAATRSLKPDIHPYIPAFMARQGGPSRIRSMDLWDEGNEHREPRRKALQVRWEEFCDVHENREVAALASGQRRGEIGKLDPLAALGRPAAGQIEAGE